MATTYFGYCDPDTGAPSETTSINLNDELYWGHNGYVCPGTGAQAIVDFGIYTQTGGNILVAIYNASDQLVVSGTSEKAKSGTSGWLLWVPGELTWSIGTALTGGATYTIAVTSDAAVNILGGTSRPAGSLAYTSGDYTAGMPDPLPSHSLYTYEPAARCGVEPAAGGEVNVSAYSTYFANMRLRNKMHTDDSDLF